MTGNYLLAIVSDYGAQNPNIPVNPIFPQNVPRYWNYAIGVDLPRLIKVTGECVPAGGPCSADITLYDTHASDLVLATHYPWFPWSSAHIRGTFTVDRDYIFEYATITMAEDAKILVKERKTLNLYETIIEACRDKLWDKIEVDGGTFIAERCTIKDAKLAIDIHSGYSGDSPPKLELRGTMLDHNKRHIKISNVLNVNPTSDFIVRQCTLSCLFPLMPPHLGEYTLCGIEISNPSPLVNDAYTSMYARSFEISDNYFSDMQYGIWTKYAGLRAFGNVFENLRGDANEARRFEGATYVPGAAFFTQYYELTVGRPGAGNRFHNCKAGVVLPDAPSVSGLQSYHAANIRIESN
ncbi:MAG: hypothetical protein RMM53_12315, partial [Bacteroidia bacterium]|nr:hypothetical protein [Bacteroidia bacterium]